MREQIEILGLHEVGRERDRVHLAAAGDIPELTYVDGDTDSVDSFGLVAPNGDALREIKRRVESENLRIISDRADVTGAEDGFSFLGPEDFAYEITVRGGSAPVQPVGFGPTRYGHFNYHPKDHHGMADFLTKVLDFRVSDMIGTQGSRGYFLRCNSEHHGIAVIQGRGTMHHHAWETQSIGDLVRLGDRLHAHGRDLLQPPIRHGAGQNLATYYLERTGAVVELYTSMEHIYDDDRPAVEWKDGEVWWNEWSMNSGYLADGFRSHGIKPTVKG